MTAGFILNRQYIQLEMPYNHFHAFFNSPLLLIVNLKTRHFYSAMFAKCSILDVWVRSECASAVCVIIISLYIFLHNLFLLLSYLWWFKLFLFQLFRFSIKLIHLHYNWQQNRIGKIGDIFQSVPTLLRDRNHRH